MRKSIIAAGATTAAVVVAMTGLAGPASAADQWEMPDVRTEILQSAVDQVSAASAGTKVKFRYNPRHVNQDVYNLTNWAVCFTSPKQGAEVPQTQKYVYFFVRRLNEKC